jgi:curved DNA-binding protein CbpA
MQLGGSSAQASEVPSLAPGCDPTRLPLSPAEGYLLSRIDGRTPWSVLREIGGLPPVEVDRCLQRWVQEGILVVASRPAGRGPAASASPAPSAQAAGPTGSAASAPPAAAAGASVSATPPPLAVDPGLALTVEAQERILAFETRLAHPYHQILGVAANADVKTVKRAYFELSKEFHPDRYFRRDIGPYKARLERVFKKIVEAYELLSDPTTRAEIERARVEEVAAPPAAAKSTPSDVGAAEEVARVAQGKAHLPHLHARRLRALAERRAKAKGFFEAGMSAFREGRWLEAAGSVRLAVAFDPANEAMKESFADVQRKAHEERAKQLMSEAEGAMQMKQYKDALPLYEEALFFRPHDAELSHKTARLAWLVGEDLKKAKEYAATAVELEPENGGYHRTLGQVYKAAGLVANARRELEAALRIDPKDAEAKDELRGLSRK